MVKKTLYQTKIIIKLKISKDKTIRDGGAINSVLVFETKEKLIKTTYYKAEGENLIAPFARILIKRIGATN